MIQTERFGTFRQSTEREHKASAQCAQIGPIEEESVCAKFAHCKSSRFKKQMRVAPDMRSCAIGSVPLHVGRHLEDSGELVRDSVVAFFATAATTAESSVVQEKALRKIRPRIHFFDMVMMLLIAESQPQEEDV